MNKERWLKPAGATLGALALIAIGYLALPIGFPDTDTYFEKVGKRALQDDENGQVLSLQETYLTLSLSGDDFEGWNTEHQTFWKYSIAFAFYGLPSAIIINPEKSDEYRALMDMMIWAMKSKKVWGDFTDRGFGADPISIQNIMYKGHLNLMYGLYQLSTGDQRYAREYTWLTGQIAEEMRLHHEGIYEGVTCEPNAWFVECNTIAMLSLHVYDKLYGTTYTDNEIQWSLDFIMERMRDKETGLFYRYYQPNHDFVREDISGYANAWIVTFLNPFLPEEMSEAYQSFKKNLTVGYGPYATVYNRLQEHRAPDTTAHLFGLLAAKEFGDQTLFGELRNAIDKVGDLSVDYQRGGLIYDHPDNRMINGVVLASKLHLGWDTVLSHDWGFEGIPYPTPETANMSWSDLLPQRIYDRNGRGSMPQHSEVRPCPNCFWGDYASERMKFNAEQSSGASGPACSTDLPSSCGLKALLSEEEN